MVETKQILSWLWDKAARAHDHSYARMLNMTAKRMQELDEKQRWIPVSERLPLHGEICLCCLKFDEMRTLQWDNIYQWWLGYGHGDYWQKSDVTHWMPLPEPPKEV